MKIYSMTATFGKLQHETITLQPGLNIIDAPNEWGKTTWCAFLVNMLYGIDTRARSGGSVLVDKERYAPWSGAPMSGRIELNWDGRDITIERSSKGRIPLGEFRAYETHTGIAVTELNAANCGQQLLGVERPVFSRAGFIRLQDMPVTQDDALRRRLNALVTTGDESAAGDRLGSRLRELRNKVRSNRANGLLPQAEAQRQQLRQELEQLQEQRDQIRRLQALQKEQESQMQILENHLDGLHYQTYRQGQEQIQQAQQQCQLLQQQLETLQSECARLPSLQTAEEMAEQAGNLIARKGALEAEERLHPQAPLEPATPQIYIGLTGQGAVAKAEQDLLTRQQLLQQGRKAMNPLWAGLGIGLGILAVVLALRFGLQLTHPALIIGGIAAIVITEILCLALALANTRRNRAQLEQLNQAHPGLNPEDWLSHAQDFARIMEQYAQRREGHRELTEKLASKRVELLEDIQKFCPGTTLQAAQSQWQLIADKHLQVAATGKKLRDAQQYAQALQAVAVSAPPPAFPDTLTISREQTLYQLEQLRLQHQNTHLQLGQSMGKTDSKEQEALIRSRLDRINRRIAQLEETYEALALAQDALYQATTILQRRFAPRISKRAQELFSRLTQGRYQKITLGDDFSMSTSTAEEDTLRPAQWRSDGTVDQLYFALRLAVAAELTPNAPLVLDDALVRFDDMRLKQALQVLNEEAQHKQVILFTCQGREAHFGKKL